MYLAFHCCVHAFTASVIRCIGEQMDIVLLYNILQQMTAVTHLKGEGIWAVNEDSLVWGHLQSMDSWVSV